MGSLKNCRKRLKQSSKLFRFCIVLLLIALVLDLTSFCSHLWVVDISGNWNYGLWKVCSTEPNNGSRGGDEMSCQPITGSHNGVWAPTISSNTSDMLPPPWFQAVQTSEVLGLICLATAVIIVFSLLSSTAIPRLEKMMSLACLLAGVFIDAGLMFIVWVFQPHVYYFGYSIWTALVASIVCYIISILLMVDVVRHVIRNVKEEHGITTGKSIALHVCGCGSTKTVNIPSLGAPVYDETTKPFYSAMCKKPPKHTSGHGQRPSSEIYLHSYLSVPTSDVYKPLSDGQLTKGVFLDVPKIRVTQPLQRRMSCPERRL